jgi:NAD(P)-dependent dehydrogenase (short-subunit alcohol dehydrogenase family)
MASLKDKIVVLTGVSRGIGAGTALLLAEDRPTLILCARTAEANADTKSAVEAIGAVAEAHGFDVADSAAAKALVDDVVARHGRIDVLINNAGTIKLDSIADLSPEEFAAVHRINLMGPYNMIFAALPSMLEHNAGTIINLASRRAFNPSRYWSAVCSSKAALISMTQCLHHDVKDAGIKVYAFSPGFTQTDMVKEIFASEVYRNSERAGDQVESPLERPARVLTWLAREAPEDLAASTSRCVSTISASVPVWRTSPLFRQTSSGRIQSRSSLNRSIALVLPMRSRSASDSSVLSNHSAAGAISS